MKNMNTHLKFLKCSFALFNIIKYTTTKKKFFHQLHLKNVFSLDYLELKSKKQSRIIMLSINPLDGRERCKCYCCSNAFATEWI